MSDPVTNVEIEDVLSSIRKLVSEGEQSRVRDMAPEQAAPKQASETESKPGKLVLTPDHMVSDAPEPEEEVAEAKPEPLKLTQIVWDEPGETEDQSAEQEPDAWPQDDVSTSPEHPAEDSWDLGEEGAAPEPGAPAADIDIAADEDQPADSGTTATSRSELEAAIAELEASVGGEFEPDGSEAQEIVDAVPWPGSRRMPDAAIEDIGDAWEAGAEPTGDSQDHADTAAETPDAAPADTEASPASFDDEIEEALAGANILDEEVLRQLVSDIVREELQGALGERITRNVRKLVRREIYRILSSQEFD